MTWQLKPAMNQGTNGEVKGDFRVVCDSAEDLLRATADIGGEKVAALRARVDQSLKDLKSRVSEAQGAVVDRAKADARAADMGGEKVAALRARVDQSLKDLKSRVSEAQGAVVDRAKADARAADAYVHENPWKTVGLAAGAGLLVGVLLARSRS